MLLDLGWVLCFVFKFGDVGGVVELWCWLVGCGGVG